MHDETIVAIATPPGRGGVGIVRVSGACSLKIAHEITRLTTINPRVIHYCSYFNKEKTLIDKGLLLFFKAPHSFTGEDIIEFQAHGSPVVLDLLLQECINYGARLAKPGEFSERAFLNDKIDLTQAEAIADLINASSQTAARLAVNSLQGEFSQKIHHLNEKIIHLRLFVEAAIDFPEEEIDFLNDGKIANLLNEVIQELQHIITNASQGVMIREGLSIVIAGRPNAGKSTLINKLAGRDIAIVTDIAGTTRDVMREHILLDDIPLHIIDTAGLRESDDPVEIEGIKRAWQEVSKADCVLLVIDKIDKEKPEKLSKEIRNALPIDVPIIHIFNKIDKLQEKPHTKENTIHLSAKSGEGIELLKEKIKEVVGYQPTEGHFLARRRHMQALEKACNLLLNGQKQLESHKAGELLAEDLRLAHQSLCEITGEFTSDDLLGVIFSSFCIGK
ncbi:GTPase (plasmid) [Legionella adelaidensis]|uniref:tRNA modification GTPase MnmE n=1 Tax=Legionella adelaidensis TaxID=45056 RepID=A0A0W0R180_9GAMM|nr:tRNA uridine-5-carboxymethylaminomethyl(34) synthesis GTPase MnmE [Legionella adelaidensis]KTC64805.1 GTPase [Legionella adelaidensis]VEH86205.1 GTPase [Legionella adelaidensis]